MKKITFFSIFFLAALMAAGQQASISGSVLKPDGTVANGATVKLLGAQGQLLASTVVSSNGNYEFTGLATGREYTVQPELQGQPLTDVTTFDIVRGAQHILGLQLLDSPLKLLASDVNRSNSLTTFDLVMLRQLILRVIVELPEDWRFVRTDIQFQNDDDPWQGFTAGSSTVLLENDISGFDFYAIKTGDLSW